MGRDKKTLFLTLVVMFFLFVFALSGALKSRDKKNTLCNAIIANYLFLSLF